MYFLQMNYIHVVTWSGTVELLVICNTEMLKVANYLKSTRKKLSVMGVVWKFDEWVNRFDSRLSSN